MKDLKQSVDYKMRKALASVEPAQFSSEKEYRLFILEKTVETPRAIQLLRLNFPADRYS